MRQSLMMSNGKVSIFFNRPISAVILALAAAMLVAPPLFRLLRGRRRNGEPPRAEAGAV